MSTQKNMKRMIAGLSMTAVLGISCIGGLQAFAEEDAEDAAPALTVESSLYGSAYTNGKSTLKAYLDIPVTYEEDSAAVFTITLPDGSEVDDSKIDCSSASVILDEGEGYFPEEYVFLASDLEGSWEDGVYTYTLSEGDLEIDRSVYPQEIDINSGREWSCLGGDGNGNYSFNLTVSGIQYDGTELESQTFPLKIRIYGHDYTNDAVSSYGEEGTQPIEPVFVPLSEQTEDVPEVTDTPVWVWVGDDQNGKPVLCDHLEDDFYICWGDEADASALTSEDVTITLESAGGETLTLEPDVDYYLSSDENETQIAVVYQNWAFIPVYETMTIEVSSDSLEASEVYDIGSVYAYEVQQGGNTNMDGSVVAYSFYGIDNLTSAEQIFDAGGYILNEQEDDIRYYYAEDAEGNGMLTEDADEAKVFEFDRNLQLVGNTVYITGYLSSEEEMDVDGEPITFSQRFNGALLSPSDCDQSLTASSGYAIPWGTSNWITNEKWAWQTGIEEGWTGITIEPYTGKIEWDVAPGTSEQFEASIDGEPVDVEWILCGPVDEGTFVDENGVLTVSEEETNSSFVLTAVSADGTRGSLTVNAK